jgi:hypothetical protein
LNTYIIKAVAITGATRLTSGTANRAAIAGTPRMNARQNDAVALSPLPDRGVSMPPFQNTPVRKDIRSAPKRERDLCRGRADKSIAPTD